MDQDDSIRLMKMNSQGADANDCLKILSFSKNSNIKVDQCLDEPRYVGMKKIRT